MEAGWWAGGQVQAGTHVPHYKCIPSQASRTLVRETVTSLQPSKHAHMISPPRRSPSTARLLTTSAWGSSSLACWCAGLAVPLSCTSAAWPWSCTFVLTPWVEQVISLGGRQQPRHHATPQAIQEQCPARGLDPALCAGLARQPEARCIAAGGRRRGWRWRRPAGSGGPLEGGVPGCSEVRCCQVQRLVDRNARVARRCCVAVRRATWGFATFHTPLLQHAPQHNLKTRTGSSSGAVPRAWRSGPRSAPAPRPPKAASSACTRSPCRKAMDVGSLGAWQAWQADHSLSGVRCLAA